MAACFAAPHHPNRKATGLAANPSRQVAGYDSNEADSHETVDPFDVSVEDTGFHHVIYPVPPVAPVPVKPMSTPAPAVVNPVTSAAPAVVHPVTSAAPAVVPVSTDAPAVVSTDAPAVVSTDAPVAVPVSTDAPGVVPVSTDAPVTDSPVTEVAQPIVNPVSEVLPLPAESLVPIVVPEAPIRYSSLVPLYNYNTIPQVMTHQVVPHNTYHQQFNAVPAQGYTGYVPNVPYYYSYRNSYYPSHNVLSYQPTQYY